MFHWIIGEDGTMIRGLAINGLTIEQCDSPLHWCVWAEAPGVCSLLKTFYHDKGQALGDAERFRDLIAHEIYDGTTPMMTTICN